MASPHQPTTQDILLALKHFNEWEEEQELQALPQMAVAKTLYQYFELCDLARGWRPNPELDLRWMLEDKALWIELTNRYLQQSRG